jgi:two-component system, response regulator PdtaR
MALGPAPGPPPPAPDGRLVLVVEDEFLIAMDLELLLRRHGWRVLGPAATVAEALRLLRSETPDVALLDINLRGEPVTPVAEELRAQGVPFVLASAYDHHGLEAAAALAGAPNLGKPTDEQSLLTTLAHAVTEPRLAPRTRREALIWPP